MELVVTTSNPDEFLHQCTPNWPVDRQSASPSRLRQIIPSSRPELAVLLNVLQLFLLARHCQWYDETHLWCLLTWSQGLGAGLKPTQLNLNKEKDSWKLGRVGNLLVRNKEVMEIRWPGSCLMIHYLGGISAKALDVKDES